jgi:hypothetical protein
MDLSAAAAQLTTPPQELAKSSVEISFPGASSQLMWPNTGSRKTEPAKRDRIHLADRPDHTCAGQAEQQAKIRASEQSVQGTGTRQGWPHGGRQACPN